MLLTKGLKSAVKHYPNKCAVEDGDMKLTYKELYERVNRLSSSLWNQGVRKGDRIGILMVNNYRFIEIKYAALLIGAIFSPISTRLALPEMKYILNDLEPSHLFIGQEFVTLLPEIKSITSIQNFVLAADEEQATSVDAINYNDLFKEVPRIKEIELHQDDIAGIYYTGGTTGNAKGVMLSHQNMVSNMYHTLALSTNSCEDVYLHVNPMFHLAGSAPIFSYVTLGAKHCFSTTFDPEMIFEKIEKLKVTRTTFVPSMVNMLINHPTVGDFDLSSLKCVRYGASPMPFEVLQKAYEVLKCNFAASYGMTEASPVLASLSEEDHLNGFQGDSEQLRRRLKSVGREVMGVEVQIVDDEGNQVAHGEVGEITARGPNIMKGYWKKTKETEEALKDGWYYTGDMGFYDEDEYIYLVDRKKDMIISGGLNIYSVEVENAIYQSPEILEAAIIGVPDDKWIEAVKAVVVLKPGLSLTEEELLTRCRQHLAGYKVPKSVEFVESLPKSAAGKILKVELRNQYLKKPITSREKR